MYVIIQLGVHQSVSIIYLIIHKYNCQILWLELANILFSKYVMNTDTQREILLLLKGNISQLIKVNCH